MSGVCLLVVVAVCLGGYLVVCCFCLLCFVFRHGFVYCCFVHRHIIREDKPSVCPS